MRRCIMTLPHCRCEREEICRRRHEIVAHTGRDNQHQRREQDAHLLVLQLLAGDRAELRTDDAAGDEDCGEHDVDGLVLDGVQDRRERGRRTRSETATCR